MVFNSLYLKMTFSIVIVLLINVITVVLSIIPPMLIGSIIDILFNTAELSHIYSSIIALFLIYVFVSTLEYLSGRISNKITFFYISKLREDCFKSICLSSTEWIDITPQGNIVSTIITDMQILCDNMLISVPQLINSLLTIILTIVFMLMINTNTAFIVLLITPISIITTAIITKLSAKNFAEAADTRAYMNAVSTDALNNHGIITAFSAKRVFLGKYERLNESLYSSGFKSQFYSSLTNPSSRFINNLMYATVCIVGGIYCANGVITIGALSAMLNYSIQYTKPFNSISATISDLQNAYASFRRIKNLVNAVPKETITSDITLPVKDIVIEDLSFAYNTNKKVIDSVSLRVNSGEKIAFVGETGSGKTTLINLIMGFYRPTGGRILINNKDINLVSKDQISKIFGMVAQDPWVFNGSIRENILYGSKNISDDILEQTCKMYNLDSLIDRLPNGLDTIISDDSIGISQGEKQLICISRLMLIDPQIIILDEATSNIDTLTEAKINSSMQKFMQNKTCFIVAHRLSTITKCDKIAIIRDGKITAFDSHDSLIKTNDYYIELFNSQFK